MFVELISEVKIERDNLLDLILCRGDEKGT